MPYRNSEDKRNHNRRWMAQRRADFFADKQCTQCGSTDRLELDHIDPDQKELEPRALWGMALNNPRRVRELAKCQVLCFDCHLEKSASELRRLLVHGTQGGYSKGCHCTLCKAAHAECNRKYL